MIRVWLWEEAPAELRGYPGLEEAVRRGVPAWLAHLPDAAGEEADLIHDFTFGWSRRRGRELHRVRMAGNAGLLLAGCMADAHRAEESRL